MNEQKKVIENLLNMAGVTINGDNPWDIKVHNEKFYSRVLSAGTLGLGEAYMDGWWDCDQLDEFFSKVLHANLGKKISLNWATTKAYLQSRFFNLQTKKDGQKVGRQHYDLGTKL